MPAVARSHDQVPRALIVEPHEDTRAMYRACFPMGAWRIDEADDGRVALALALATAPDVIVTEECLPGISGLDLCRVLRADPVTSRVPILLLTSDVQPTLAQAATACGVDAVLTKPCRPDVLKAELERALSARQPGPRTDAGDGEVRIEKTRQADGGADDSAGAHKRQTLVRAHRRQVTSTPPLDPPPLVCPECDTRLSYERSHVGGVSVVHGEQWDYFRCPSGCGEYQYRQRTRRFRRL